MLILIEAIKMNCFRLVMFPSIVHFILFWLTCIVSGSSKCLEILTKIHSSAKVDEKRNAALSNSTQPTNQRKMPCVWIESRDVFTALTMRVRMQVRIIIYGQMDDGHTIAHTMQHYNTYKDIVLGENHA